MSLFDRAVVARVHAKHSGPLRATSLVALGLAVLMAAGDAAAQTVVVFPVTGSDTARLETQIRSVVSGSGASVMDFGQFKERAVRVGIDEGTAVTPGGIAKVAADNTLDLAVSISVVGGEQDAPAARIAFVDFIGRTVWTKDLPMSEGVLNADLAAKLGRAVKKAAELAHSQRPTVVVGTPDAGATPAAVASHDAGVVSEVGLAAANVVADGGVGTQSDSGRGLAASARGPVDGAAAAAPTGKSGSAETESLGNVISVEPTAALTWHSLRACPGTATCGEYATRTVPPAGSVLELASSAPYGGFRVGAEAFLAVRAVPRWVRGFGLIGGLGFGWTPAVLVTATGGTQSATLVDRTWSAALAYRAPLTFKRVRGRLGVNAGVSSRAFLVPQVFSDRTPGTHRLAPTIGIEIGCDVSKWFGLVLAGDYWIAARPGAEATVAFGNGAGGSSRGLAARATIGGAIWGPLRYRLQAQLTNFLDTYVGPGAIWTTCNATQCGGSSTETFVDVQAGVQAAF